MDESVFSQTLESNRGRVVLFDFWATWCVPCRTELPKLAKLEKALRSRGFVLVTVSADEPEQERVAVEFLRTVGVRFPAYIKRVKNDEKFINYVEPQWSGALPAVFLFGRDGRLAKSLIGETGIDELAAQVGKLL